MVNVNPLPADNQALRPDALAHIVLRTRNPDAMIKWYEDFLGAVVAFRYARFGSCSGEMLKRSSAVLVPPSCNVRPPA
jgi:hypothetical protein